MLKLERDFKLFIAKYYLLSGNKYYIKSTKLKIQYENLFKKPFRIMIYMIIQLVNLNMMIYRYPILHELHSSWVSESDHFTLIFLERKTTLRGII